MTHRLLSLCGALLGSLLAAPIVAQVVIDTGVQVNTQSDGDPTTSRVNLRTVGVISGGARPVRLSDVKLFKNGQEVLGRVSAQLDLCVTLLPEDPDDPVGFPFELEFRYQEDLGAPSAPVRINVSQGTSIPNPECKDRAAPVLTSPGAPYTNTGGTEGVALDIPVSALLSVVRDPNGDAISVVGVDAGSAVNGSVSLAGSTVTFTPDPGENGTNFHFTYTVRDSDNLTSDFTANLTFAAFNDAPVANDTPDCVVGEQGGVCTLNISDPDNSLSELSFTLVTPSENGTVDVASFDPQARTVVYTPRSVQGPHSFEYLVTDPGERASEPALVTITVSGEPRLPTASLVLQRPQGQVINPPDISDTDDEDGEQITLDAVSSTVGFPVSSIVEWHFAIDNVPLSGTSQSAVTTRLANGNHVVSVFVVDAAQRQSPTVSVNVNVEAPPNNPPATSNVVISINGEVISTELFVQNEDFEPGESVALDASGSTDPDGGPLTFEWALMNGTTATVISTAATATVRLPDGSNRLRLTITDSENATASREVTVNVVADPNLAAISGLSPNQSAVARAVDELCPRLNEVDSEELSEDQQDLLTKCSNLIAATASTSQQAAALDAMTGEELTAAQRTGINISNLNLTNVGARLTALRGGATGVNFAGLSVLDENGTRLPLQELAQLAKDLFGSTGGAGGEEEGGGLLDRKLGIFINGRVGFGSKDRTTNESGYDLDTYGVTLGADYRFTDHVVLGLAAGFGSSETEFDNDGGSLKSDGYSLSLYGSYYGDRFYFDAIGTFGTLDHDSKRRISYTLPTEPQPIDLTASGKSDGSNFSGGLSAGYNFGSGGWTFGPTLALTLVDVEVDGFSETGAAGLNLEFGDQSAKSMQVQAGAQVGYALSRTWGVLSPQARVAYVKENEDDAESILVRFVNDPFVTDLSQPSTTTFLINTDAPDSEFVQWGVGFSALFRNGVSGFINYEAYSALEATEYGEITLGVRFERSW